MFFALRHTLRHATFAFIANFYVLFYSFPPYFLAIPTIKPFVFYAADPRNERSWHKNRNHHRNSMNEYNRHKTMEISRKIIKPTLLIHIQTFPPHPCVFSIFYLSICIFLFTLLPILDYFIRHQCLHRLMDELWPLQFFFSAKEYSASYNIEHTHTHTPHNTGSNFFPPSRTHYNKRHNSKTNKKRRDKGVF